MNENQNEEYFDEEKAAQKAKAKASKIESIEREDK